MHPFVITELESTQSFWFFFDSGKFIGSIAADDISIQTQQDVIDPSVQKWLSVWTPWTSWTPPSLGNNPCYYISSEDKKFGSKLPKRERTCQSTNNFYCIGAAEETNWIERQKCPGPCGDLTDKDENCLNIADSTDESESEWLKTKCVISSIKPIDGQHACGAKGTKLPVPMTKTEIQAWLRGYDQCDFEFHSDKARLPVGIFAENNKLISLIDGAETQHDFKNNSILEGGWKKSITGCYNILKKNTAGLNEEKCGQNGYCCSGFGKNNGEELDPRYHNNIDHACPLDAIFFIDDNNLQDRHHCLRQGIL